MSNEDEPRKLTKHFPRYSNVRLFIRIVNGLHENQLKSMDNQLYEQRGTPQQNMDWSDPNKWIFERLDGDEQHLALKIWNESENNVNPRFLAGIWALAKNHQLTTKDNTGILRLTTRGNLFLNLSDTTLLASIDDYEGIFNILQVVAERSPARRSELLPDYSNFCRTFTTYRSDTVINMSLYERLTNLLERGYVMRNGQAYEISESGLAYLNLHNDRISGRSINKNQPDLLRLTKAMNKDARDQLAVFLQNINPFKFEDLISLLLEKMGYENVETTSPTNDKGVDVVADIKLGISQVREVVQVKRYSGNINRPVLDGLRGSLHRFRAVRGTIITTGGFTKGTEEAAFEVGAAPITLIDGDRLLDLLTEYEIGVSRKSVDYIEFDPTELTPFDTNELLDSIE